MRSQTFAMVLALPVAGLAQDRSLNPALHVVFVGELESERGKDFVQFLRAQFPRVDAIERAKCSPEQLRTADVVVLDWPQEDGVMAKFHKKEPCKNLLGERARWDRPTVLIGSAGLNLATEWGLPGGYG
jgi:hypothetical protein